MNTADYHKLCVDVVTLALAYMQSNRHLRLGQAHFNALDVVNGEMADEIRGTMADPFYCDDKMPEFWAAVNKLSEQS